MATLNPTHPTHLAYQTHLTYPTYLTHPDIRSGA